MPIELAILRILDANLNRAAEGLRVVEEYTRFVLNDAHLTNICKSLRHDLMATAAGFLPQLRLSEARDTLADVGTNARTAGEYLRRDSDEVAAASHKRVEQALRCLEEYTKTFDADLAVQFERLRYRAYTLGKACLITAASQERLRHARLYVLIDGRASEEEFQQLAQGLIRAGVDVLQLRDKQLSDRVLLSRARLLRKLTAGTSTLFIMNDRPDFAVLAGADGVHVGQDEISVHDARSILGPNRLVGVSTHSLPQARQAVLGGANYLGCGPTFPSLTKQFESFPGLAFLEQVRLEINLPAFAIGGISLANLPQVLGTGFQRVAIRADIVDAVDVAGRVKAYRAALFASSDS